MSDRSKQIEALKLSKTSTGFDKPLNHRTRLRTIDDLKAQIKLYKQSRGVHINLLLSLLEGVNTKRKQIKKIEDKIEFASRDLQKLCESD